MNTKNIRCFDFDDDIVNGNDCILHLGISGSKEFIRKILQETIKEIDSSYGKPIQGIISQYGGTKHVITPKWNGKEY
jgi:hypothetical protein